MSKIYKKQLSSRESSITPGFMILSKSSQLSYSQSIYSCLAGVEGSGEESYYGNASRFEVHRPFSRGSASRERGKKKRRLRPLISSGVVRSLLTQHY